METGKKLTVAEAQMKCLERNIPFYSWRSPRENVYHFGAQVQGGMVPFDQMMRVENKSGFIVVPFQERSDCPALFIQGNVEFADQTDSLQIISDLLHAGEKTVNGLVCQASTSREAYQQEIKTMICALKDGKARKMVLARQITLFANVRKNAACWFDRLACQYPDAFVFWVSIPGVMNWMGATPEIFLRRQHDEIETMALAGTQPAGDVLHWQRKELEEQAIVSDYILNCLANVTDVSWQVTGPFPRRAGGIVHLCTTFRSSVPLSTSLVERIRHELHPTPAVGGFPKEIALELMRQIENYDRRYYAGYLGPVEENGDFEWYVNLRSMELFSETVTLYVGGGITALSDPDKEWEETEMKSHTLLSVLQE